MQLIILYNELIVPRPALTSQGTFVEGMKEEVVLSPAHALSLIAAGEGNFCNDIIVCVFWSTCGSIVVLPTCHGRTFGSLVVVMRMTCPFIETTKKRKTCISQP